MAEGSPSYTSRRATRRGPRPDAPSAGIARGLPLLRHDAASATAAAAAAAAVAAAAVANATAAAATHHQPPRVSVSARWSGHGHRTPTMNASHCDVVHWAGGGPGRAATEVEKGEERTRNAGEGGMRQRAEACACCDPATSPQRRNRKAGPLRGTVTGPAGDAVNADASRCERGG